jgi:hypothetical protein
MRNIYEVFDEFEEAKTKGFFPVCYWDNKSGNLMAVLELLNNQGNLF